jgi:hypothetical protein
LDVPPPNLPEGLTSFDGQSLPVKMETMEGINSIAVALPHGKFFDRLYDAVLQPWAEERKANIRRVDLNASSIGALCSAVENIDLLVADISGRDFRVIYLAGYAHGLGKRVLFITQLEHEFPFHETRQVVITYSGNLDLLRAELDRFASGEKNQPSKISDDPRSKFNELFSEILRRHGHEHRGAIEMENPSTFVLLEQDMDLPLVQELSRRARELGVRLKLM